MRAGPNEEERNDHLMPEVRLVSPEIYASFSCKCGECRHTCCSGWGISVSDAEYFRLLGMDCGEELRRRLDCAFMPANDPSPERYALIAPSYVGNCRILRDDGLCGLHAECGESALPLICRVYPRAIRRMDGWYELSASLACERTVELLMRDDAPLAFTECIGEVPQHSIAGARSDASACALRQSVLQRLGDRGKHLSERLAEVAELLTGKRPPLESNESVARHALSFMRYFIRIHGESHGLSEIGGRALSAIDAAEDPLAHLASGERRLRALLPSLDAYLEKLLVHHAFHMQLPFVDSPQGVEAQTAAFLTAAALLRFCIFAIPISSIDEFVDTVAELFRFIEHSGYYFSLHNGVPM